MVSEIVSEEGYILIHTHTYEHVRIHAHMCTLKHAHKVVVNAVIQEARPVIKMRLDPSTATVATITSQVTLLRT